MFFKKNEEKHISGDYQFKALTSGPVSQRLWHRAKQDLIKKYVVGKNYRSICDAGCGSGVVARAVSELAPEAVVTGYDLFEESIAFAREKYTGSTNLCFEVRDLLQPPSDAGNEFDFIYSMEVLEHFAEDEARGYLENLFDMGKSKTRYLLTTPNYRSLWPLIEYCMDIFHLAPKLAGHQHLIKFSKPKLRSYIEGQGFTVLDMYNFCGLAPFAGHISLGVSQGVAKIEQKLGAGNLIACLFEKP